MIMDGNTTLVVQLTRIYNSKEWVLQTIYSSQIVSIF